MEEEAVAPLPVVQLPVDEEERQTPHLRPPLEAALELTPCPSPVASERGPQLGYPCADPPQIE